MSWLQAPLMATPAAPGSWICRNVPQAQNQSQTAPLCPLLIWLPVMMWPLTSYLLGRDCRHFFFVWRSLLLLTCSSAEPACLHSIRCGPQIPTLPIRASVPLALAAGSAEATRVLTDNAPQKPPGKLLSPPLGSRSVEISPRVLWPAFFQENPHIVHSGENDTNRDE